jgi:hypothetical protein
MLKIHWPDKVSNQQLHERPWAISLYIKNYSIKTMGVDRPHPPETHQLRLAFTWAPEGKRKGGRSKNTWLQGHEHLKLTPWTSQTHAMDISNSRHELVSCNLVGERESGKYETSHEHLKLKPWTSQTHTMNTSQTHVNVISANICLKHRKILSLWKY